jgi:uncharacterized protein
MMIDCHTHLGASSDTRAQAIWRESRRIPSWVAETYLEAMKSVDRAILVAAPWEPEGIQGNESVALFASEYPKIIPFLVVDPASPTAYADLARAVEEQGARGIKLGPIYQGFRPDDERYFPLYEAIQDRLLPILWHQGSSFVAVQGPLEWANPVLLDKVARAFPELKMVVAHLGFPWIRETVALVRKQPNVFTDVSALASRTWVLYNGLVDLVQYGGEDKVLFGSDYDASTPAQMQAALQRAAAIPAGTNLPPIPQEVVEAILHRDTLGILGIA